MNLLIAFLKWLGGPAPQPTEEESAQLIKQALRSI